MARLGFVGTGTMGAPMAVHLVGAGHEVAAFDAVARAVAPVVAAGGHASGTAAAAAAGADCVLLSLPGPREVEAAVTGPGGVLEADPPPARVVDLSTSSPTMARSLAERCAAEGVGFLDAPVSGGRARAETGTLSVLVGGDGEGFAAVEPLLRCFASEVFHVGAVGAGTVAKLVNNQLFLAAGVLVQEAYVLGAAAGLDPSDLHPILKASSAGPYAALAPLLLGRDFDDVTFRLDIAAKDLGLVVEVAEDLGVDVPTTTGALSVYRQAVAAGLGNSVFHATLQPLERAAGIALAPLRRTPRPS